MSKKSNTPLIVGGVGAGALVLWLALRKPKQTADEVVGMAPPVAPDVRRAQVRRASVRSRAVYDAAMARARGGRGAPQAQITSTTIPSTAEGTFRRPSQYAEITFNPSRTAISFGDWWWGALDEAIEGEYIGRRFTAQQLRPRNIRGFLEGINRVMRGEPSNFFYEALFDEAPPEVLAFFAQNPGARAELGGLIRDRFVEMLKGRLPSEILKLLGSANRELLK